MARTPPPPPGRSKERVVPPTSIPMPGVEQPAKAKQPATTVKPATSAAIPPSSVLLPQPTKPQTGGPEENNPARINPNDDWARNIPLTATQIRMGPQVPMLTPMPEVEMFLANYLADSLPVAQLKKLLRTCTQLHGIEATRRVAAWIGNRDDQKARIARIMMPEMESLHRVAEIGRRQQAESAIAAGASNAS